MMRILENVRLSKYSTMRLGGKARYLASISSKTELVEALDFAKQKELSTIMIGGGSNIIWRDEGYDGLVLVNTLSSFKVRDIDKTNIELFIGAGEDWDEIVKKTVELGYSGIEQLSFIPGTVGATPVQNVGAYGCEIKDVLVSVEAFDSATDKYVVIPKNDCQFGYRTSRFKTSDKNRFFITGITLKLSKTNPKPPFYDSLQKYFEENNIKTYTPKSVREAVIAVRTSKLPDPDVVANNGSFFANPVIDRSKFATLEIKFPGIVCWEQKNNKVKLSAAWLIEQAGFKDYHDKATGMATWDKQPLVLINEHARSTQDVIDFRDKIIQTVRSKFGITLEQEPELI